MGKMKDLITFTEGNADLNTVKYLTEHLSIMTKLGDEMAEYLTHKEEDDYHDQCFENGREEFKINIQDLWHIWQTVLYWKYVSGYEIDPRYQFVDEVPLRKRTL